MSQWGSHTSLYGTLPPDEVYNLEQAIRLQVRGDYAGALKLFSLLPESASRLPVAIIEHAVLYERMGLVQEQLKILNTLKSPPKARIEKPGADEWDLINQLRASAELWANGNLELAFTQACLTARQLKRKELNAFSDIEVRLHPSFPSQCS